MELREKIAGVIEEAVGRLNLYDPDDPGRAADAILAIPEIREALILFGSDTAAKDGQ